MRTNSKNIIVDIRTGLIGGIHKFPTFRGVNGTPSHSDSKQLLSNIYLKNNTTTTTLHAITDTRRTMLVTSMQFDITWAQAMKGNE